VICASHFVSEGFQLRLQPVARVSVSTVRRVPSGGTDLFRAMKSVGVRTLPWSASQAPDGAEGQPRALSVVVACAATQHAQDGSHQRDLKVFAETSS
jgi:hypothetical protein